MTFKKISILIVIALFAVVSACETIMPDEPAPEEVLAEPIEDLTPAQLNLHLQGDGEFARIFSQAEGLGPIFVQASCESCHIGDGKGHLFTALTRFGQYEQDGVTWNSLLNQGGPQLQHRSIANYPAEAIPNGVRQATFIAPNVTGLGFLEAVTDQTILDLMNEQALAGIVSGTVNYVDAPDFFTPKAHHIPNGQGQYIGRFGRKAAAIDLVHQTTNAYKQDMGITSDFDLQDPINYAVSGLSGDNVADPEIPAGTVNAVAFYIQTLKAPPRRNTNDPQVIAGENIFKQIGCENCHKQTLTAGPSIISEINNKDFHPYTDMLLHDMGPELDDGYTEGSVATSEWRTMPLWGLGLQKDSQGGTQFLLHDGRATNYNQAIQLHGGEADFARANYRQLSQAQKDQLFKFLDSL